MEIKSLHKIKSNQRLKVAAYARISSNKDELETSLDEQIDYYTRIIVANPNWEFAGIYYDDGISGTTISQRKGFQAMVENAKAGLIDIILVKSVSRFARNLIDLLTTLRELRNIGVEIYFEQQQTSSLDVKCDQMITMYADFAEEEAISVSQNCKWRVNKNIKDGSYHLPTAQMMGYRYDKNGNVVIYEPEARTIQKIYKLYLSGYGCSQIAEFLTRSKEMNRIGQTKWERSTIRNILRNEKYVGDFIFQKSYIESPLTHKVIINHGERDRYLVENGHPAIINRDDWNKVQDIMNANSKKFKVPSYENGTYVHPINSNRFLGFISCPYCHNNYILKRNRRNGEVEKTFLSCSANKSAKICNSDNYPIEEFEKIVIKALATLRQNVDELKPLLQSAFKDNSSYEREQRITALDNKIEEHRKKLLEINGFMDDFYMKQKDSLLEIISDLTKEKNTLINANLTAENVDSRIRKITKAISSLPKKMDSLEGVDFTEIFSKAIVVNKGLIYFIIGKGDMDKYPLRPKLIFKSNHRYMVRKTSISTNYGIMINR